MLPPKDKPPLKHCVPPLDRRADRATELETRNIPPHLYRVQAGQLGRPVALRRVRLQL
jgi:hypothetical protein